METQQSLRGVSLVTVSVGDFAADKKLAPETDKELSLRGGNTVSSPVDGSFAQYLKATLVTELKAANLLDATSDTVIAGTLTGIDVDAAMSEGTGNLSAQFVITRKGQQLYSRELKIHSTWESSFVGAVAIPKAAGEAEGMFRKLVKQLLDDPEFRAALKR